MQVLKGRGSFVWRLFQLHSVGMCDTGCRLATHSVKFRNPGRNITAFGDLSLTRNARYLSTKPFNMMNKNLSKATAMFLLPGLSYIAEYLIWKSFPPGYALNGVLGGLWTLGQAGIIFILYFLYTHTIANGKNISLIGVVIAAMGALSYSLNYFLGYLFHLDTIILLPLGAVLTGVGMVVTGIQVIRAKRWEGVSRYLPLTVGLYPFLIMFPLVAITGRPDLTAILCWGIPWLMLGLGMAKSLHTVNRVSSGQARNLAGSAR